MSHVPKINVDLIKKSFITKGPQILNKSSNFVVITYWWGRGKLNRNFERPCPDEEDPGSIETAITFEEMAKRWEDNMKKLKINYYIVEIPELEKTSVQDGINYKPSFILDSLKVIFPRAAVYIDGDMKINKFPHIFDIDNIDIMIHGWNNDPRSVKKEIVCWNPFVTELSGGIMYFNNNLVSKNIINSWISESNKINMKGKADDRILVVSLNKNNTKEWANIIELPKEFLWLTDWWGREDMIKWETGRKYIMVEHEQCLTSEDRAQELGSNKNRIPLQYTRLVENHVVCVFPNIFGQKIFLNIEFMYMNKKQQNTPFIPLNKVLEDNKLQKTISFENKWGELTEKINSSLQLIKNLNLNLSNENETKKQFLVYNDIDHKKYFNLNSKSKISITILKLSKTYKNIIFLPVNYNKKLLKNFFKTDKKDMTEFSIINNNKSKKDIEKNIY